MKKCIALTLALLLLAGCAPATYDGPTESVWVLTEDSTTFYIRDTGEAETSLDINSYDRFGNLVRTVSYSNGALDSENQYVYDDQGNCIREVYWEYFWFFRYPVKRCRHTYDDQNRPLSSIYRNGFGIKTGEDTYTYDDEANTLTWEGTYDHQIIYFAENGDVLRTETYSNPSGLKMECVYEYDELGRSIRETEYMNGEIYVVTEFHWDNQHHLTELTSRDSNGVVLNRTTYVYEENIVTSWDEKGYKYVECLRPDNQLEWDEVYDPQGNLFRRNDYTYTEIQIPAKEE